MKPFIVLVVLFSLSCSGSEPDNRVRPEQINNDGSTNYKYIFRDILKKEKKRDIKKNRPFQ